MQNETIFVYGTLRDPELQIRIIGRTIDGQPDQLAGYSVHYLVYPVALPDDDGVIDGLIYHVTEAELDKIDAYEGSAYVRVRVTLASGQDAWFYRGHPEQWSTLT